MRSSLALAFLAVMTAALTGCDPTEGSQAVTITNDLRQPVVLKLCDSFGCDNLNDRVLPGAEIVENVSTDLNPYNFVVADDAGRELGCLQVATGPVPVDPVPVSTLQRGNSVPCR